MMMGLLAQQAEELQLVQAWVRPVLMPVGHLDERVCIAIVGRSQGHGFWARAVSAKPLACLPGDLGHAVFSFGSLVAADFMDWCTQGRPIEAWEPPLGGLSAGDWLEVSGFDFEDTVRVSLSMTALGPGRPSGEVKEDQLSVAPRTSDESRFLDSVRSEISRVRPSLAKGFRKTLSLTGKGVAGEIDFVGHHYVTCYAAVNPKGRSASRVQTASAALWRLARARDAFGFAAPAAIELTAWVPPQGLPIYTSNEYRLVDETVNELREQARREELEVFQAVDVDTACRRLVDVEVDKPHLYS